MKRFYLIVLILSMLITFSATAVNFANTQGSDIIFDFNLASEGKIVDNLVSDVATFHFQRQGWQSTPLNERFSFWKPQLPFVEYYHFMTATGGDNTRDLFIDPNDRSTFTDYDFTVLMNACKNALSVGLKPYISLGNVPYKMSQPNDGNYYGWNRLAPDDYDVYYDYIKAIVQALVDEFGIEEVRTWKWGVYQEASNRDILRLDNAANTLQAFIKIYDYSAAAVEDVLGKGMIEIGPHLWGVGGNQTYWSEEAFIEHVATGINSKTGEVGSPITFVSLSFYTRRPGVGLTTPNYGHPDLLLADTTILKLQNKAKELGLTGLKWGIDEGRILRGTDDVDLWSRATGKSIQGAFDAALYKVMMENDISWFAAWSYTSGVLGEGLPSVSLHVANLFYNMVGGSYLSPEIAGSSNDSDNDVDAFGSFKDTDGKAYFMVYNYNDSFSSTVPEKIVLRIDGIPEGIEEVKVTKWIVNDENSNFFTLWENDYTERGLTSNDFSWSKDDFHPTLKKGSNIQFFNSKYDEYMEAAKLIPITSIVQVIDGEVQISDTIAHHTVMFYEVKDSSIEDTSDESSLVESSPVDNTPVETSPDEGSPKTSDFSIFPYLAFAIITSTGVLIFKKKSVKNN